MSISFIDEEEPLEFGKWLQEESVLTYNRELQERLLSYLQSEDNLRTFQMLALIGSDPEQSTELQAKIRSLHEWHIEPCGFKSFCKSSVSFVNEYKNEIMIGVAIVATGVGIAAITGYTLSCSVGGVVVAGAGSIFSSPEEPPLYIPPPPKHLPVDANLLASLPKLELPEDPNGFLITKEGVWCGGQFYPTSPNIPYQDVASAPTLFAGSATLPPPIYAPTDLEFPPLPIASAPKPQETPPPQPQTFYTRETFNPQSQSFHIDGKKMPSGQICWINGILNSLEDSQDNARYIQNLSGGFQVAGIYNQSHGALNILETALLNQSGIAPITSDLLVEQWNRFDQEHKNNPNAKLLQVCHSQGTALVKVALLNAPQEIRDRVIVLALAPAAIVSDEICFKSYNFASTSDLVYKAEPEPKSITSAIDGEVLVPLSPDALDYKKELIFVPKHPNEYWAFDHSAQSATLKEPIELVLADYTTHQGNYRPEERGRKK